MNLYLEIDLNNRNDFENETDSGDRVVVLKPAVTLLGAGKVALDFESLEISQVRPVGQSNPIGQADAVVRSELSERGGYAAKGPIWHMRGFQEI
jgi:hypothetical protein